MFHRVTKLTNKALKVTVEHIYFRISQHSVKMKLILLHVIITTSYHWGISTKWLKFWHRTKNLPKVQKLKYYLVRWTKKDNISCNNDTKFFTDKGSVDICIDGFNLEKTVGELVHQNFIYPF